MANLNSNSFATLVDLISEGEIEGLKNGKKSIYLNNVQLLNNTATIKSGTYSQASGTITVTCTSHGYAVGNNIVLDITSGNGVSDTYAVKTVTTNTFTVTAKDQTSTSGNVTLTKASDYNFQNVTVQSRPGTNDQSYIPGTSEISNEIAVNVVVLKDTPVVRTVTDPTVNAVRVTLSFPRLQTYNNDGSIGGCTVQVAIDAQYNSGGFNNVINDTVSGRADDNYQKDYIINLTGTFPVDIRVTRVTADSSDPKIVNEFNWTSYTEITNQKLKYPNSALVALRFAAEQFSSIPQRAYQIRGIKVAIPGNATVDSSTGALIYPATAWDGTFAASNKWTSDPAWCLWALLTNTRFGFGNFINTAVLDKWAFFQASKYCSALNTYSTSAEIAERATRGLSPRTGTTDDYNATTGKHGVPDGFGNYEPRFSCNVNIQTADEAYTLINQLCSVFRAMPFWSVGSLTVTQDKPAASSYLFTLANVSEEGFSYSGSSQKSRATVAIVSYFDMAMRDKAYEYVEDAAAIAKYGVNIKKIDAFACTSRGQAHRLGKWMLFAEGRETEVVAFTASVDSGVICRPGQIIDIADPMRAGARRGGKISAASTTVITVDDATGLTTANSPTLSVILPDGSVETKSVSAVNTATRQITVSSAFSVAPNVNSVWVFQSTDLQTSQWRVISVTEQDQCQYVINALAYNATKYDNVEYNVTLTTRDVTNLDVAPAAPTALSFSESLYSFQSLVQSKLFVTWKPVVGVNQYQIRWRQDQGNWQIDYASGGDYEILDTTPGNYDVEIYSVSALGKLSLTALSGSVAVLGKTAPPADVTGFATVLDPDIGVTLTWNPVADLDLQGYEIWEGALFGSGTKIGQFQATAKKLGLLPTGTTTWWIKALDTSDVYSANATSVSLTISGAAAPTTNGSFVGSNFVFDWSDVTGSLTTEYYEVRYGTTSSTWATATKLATVKSSIYSTVATWVGTRRFFVAAIDLKGNYGASNYYDAIVTAPSTPANISAQVIDNNVLLQWSASTGTLPVASYEIRKGNTYSTATIIGTKNGLFTSVFETSAGTYKYWVTGIDAAGNYGTSGSISADVAQPPDYVLKLAYKSTFSGTKTNLVAESSTLVGTVDTTETWQSHFTSRSWTTMQDAINAGFTIYAQPSSNTGSYVETIDYGTTLAASKVTAVLNYTQVSGSTTVTPKISISSNNTTWTDYAGLSAVYATNFRYAKITYDFSASGGDDIIRMNALNVTLDNKLKNDAGVVSAVSTDTGGTQVNFNVPFVDVDSITVTPKGTTQLTAVYDFVDAPYPTGFKVLVFNSSGNRVSCDVSWSAKGA